MVYPWGRVVKVMPRPQRHPKTGVLRFRRAVPAELQERVAAVLGLPTGKLRRELIRSLGVKDSKDPRFNRLWAAAVEWADNIISVALHGAAPLAERQMNALVGAWYQRKAHEWEADPASLDQWKGWGEGVPESPYADDPENGREEEPASGTGRVWERQWSKFLDQHMPEVDTLLAAEGVTTDPASKRRLAELIVRYLPQALAAHIRRQRGNYAPDPVVGQFAPMERSAAGVLEGTKRAPAGRPAISLSGLFAAWKVVAVVKPRSAEETRYAVEDLKKFLGHDDAALTRPEDLIRWRDAMKAAGRNNDTWNNRLSLVGQVFKRGVDDRKLTSNPAMDLRLPKARQNSPLPYDDADAAKLLNAARKETTPALRWSHWIMAFTGMRAGEVLQLVREDVCHEGGIWFLSVNEDAAGKSVKTGQTRHVPVHPALVSEGFIDYAQTILAGEPIFPDKKLDKHGQRGGKAWNVTGRWARKTAGIVDPRKAPNHSWRHRMEDELRSAGVVESERDAITGHSRKTMGGRYGVRKEALKKLHQAICLIPVPPGVALLETAC